MVLWRIGDDPCPFDEDETYAGRNFRIIGESRDLLVIFKYTRIRMYIINTIIETNDTRTYVMFTITIKKKKGVKQEGKKFEKCG